MGKQGPLYTSKLNCIIFSIIVTGTRAGEEGGFTPALPYSNQRIVKNDILRYQVGNGTDGGNETSGRLFQFVNSAKCRRTLLNTNISEKYPGAKRVRERKNRLLLFGFSIKREIRLYGTS